MSRGIQVLIPPDAGKRKGARPGWNGGACAFMRRVLDTDHGRDLYRKRQGMIEPVFADTKFNRRCDRFQRRGRSAARSEWRLITATHCAAMSGVRRAHVVSADDRAPLRRAARRRRAGIAGRLDVLDAERDQALTPRSDESR